MLRSRGPAWVPATSPSGRPTPIWVAIGLHVGLHQAMLAAVRGAVTFLSTRVGMNRATAYAYLSAAGDLTISQVVDLVLGVPCLIRKADFPGVG